MEVDGELDYDAINNKLIAGVAVTTDKKVVNQINKWLEMLDMVYYVGENQTNIMVRLYIPNQLDI